MSESHYHLFITCIIVNLPQLMDYNFNLRFNNSINT